MNYLITVRRGKQVQQLVAGETTALNLVRKAFDETMGGGDIRAMNIMETVDSGRPQGLAYQGSIMTIQQYRGMK